MIHKKKINKSALFGKPKQVANYTSNPLIKRAAVIDDFTYQEVDDWAKFIINDNSKYIKELELSLIETNSKKGVNYYTLGEEKRKEYLTKLVQEKELNSQLDFFNNHPPSSESSNYFLKFLKKETQAIQNQTLDELNQSFKVANWVNSFQLDYITPVEIYAEMQRKEFLKPLETLTQNFQGRTKELKQIKDYVDLFPKEGIIKRTAKFFKEVFSLHYKKPLLITGIGGVGKSTLIAKFILDHLSFSNQLPFVYIDFDRSVYTIDEPLFILLEAFKQLKIQFPNLSNVFDDLTYKLEDQVFVNRRVKSKRGSTKSFRKTIYQSLIRKLDKYDLNLSMIQQPILVVLDSFEELQYRGANKSEFKRFMDTIQEIAALIPRIRPVFVGRAGITFKEIKFETIELNAFDKASADAYLKHLGIQNKTFRAKIFINFGGAPLTLQLAASLAKSYKIADKKSLPPKELYSFFKNLDKSSIETELVKRNLDHIHDANVRKIAVPGLLVRAVTPEIIQKVLAEPCGLGKISLRKAKTIYNALKKETFLLRSGTDKDCLFFRPDLRKAMEEMILKKEPEKAQEVHENAVAYFKDKPVAKHQAEYIYHRLKLGEHPSFLDLATYEKLSIYLDRSNDELPLIAQVHIAQLRGSKIEPKVLKSVKIEEWEKYYVRVIQDSLKSDLASLEVAKQDLSIRNERSFNSPLNYWEARLYQRLNDIEKSDKIITKKIFVIEEDNSIGAKEELLKFKILEIENLEYRFEFNQAYRKLKEVESLKVTNSFLEFQLNVLTTRLSSRLDINENYESDLDEYKTVLTKEDLKRLEPTFTFHSKYSKSLDLDLSVFDIHKSYESYYISDRALFNDEFPYNTLNEEEYLQKNYDFKNKYPSSSKLERFSKNNLGGTLSELTEPGNYDIVIIDIYNRTNENILNRIFKNTKSFNNFKQDDNLINILAELYPTPESSIRVLKSVDIRTEYLEFESTALNNWNHLLSDISKRNKLNKFLKEVQKDYPKHGSLNKFIEKDLLTDVKPQKKIYRNVSEAYQDELSIDKDQLKSLVAQDRLEDVLSKLDLIANELKSNDYKNSIILTRGRLNSLNKENAYGLVRRDDYKFERRKIASSINYLIDQIETEKNIQDILSGISNSKPETTNKVGLQVPQKSEFEKIMRGKSSIVPIEWLDNARKSAKIVCKVELSDGGSGTGFLLKGGYLLTNHHVICKHFPFHREHCDLACETSLDCVKRARILLNFQATAEETFIYELDPESTYILNKELDYALIKIKDNPAKPLSDWGHAEFETFHLPQEGSLVNIIQHPEGETLKIALPDTVLSLWEEKNYLFYLADTLGGSSGSPVFNQDWKVVALHHAGLDEEDGGMEINAAGDKHEANRGILIGAILEDLRSKGINL